MTRYVNIKNVLGKVRRDVAYPFEEADGIEWAAEALSQIGVRDDLINMTSFVEVKDYQCLIPTGTVQIQQIAINNCYSPQDPTVSTCPSSVVESSEELADFVPLDCNGMPLSPYEWAYYRPAWDLQMDYSFFIGTTLYSSCYVPVRLSTHSFFGSLVAELPNSEDLYSLPAYEYEYTVNDPYLRFSFRTGWIAISYSRVKLDEDGYPMIPDRTSYKEAIARYIRLKTLELQYDRGESVERRLVKAEQDWHWYCKQAANEGMMPKGVDDYQDLQDMRNYLLPREHRYYGYFGRMNRPEKRVWNTR